MKIKQFSILLVITFALLLSSSVYAKNETAGQQGTAANTTGSQSPSGQGVQQPAISPTPTGNKVINQNQVVTQNQGEESQLQVNTQEQEILEVNAVAAESMSNVAEQVQELLQVKTAGGIGQQVKEIAQEQSQAQDQIQTQITKLDSKGKVARFLTGTDFQAVKTLKQQMELNQVRVQQLEELMNQLTNQGDITQVRETIQLLTDQNTALQDRVNFEERSYGLFGWLIKMFVK